MVDNKRHQSAKDVKLEDRLSMIVGGAALLGVITLTLVCDPPQNDETDENRDLRSSVDILGVHYPLDEDDIQEMINTDPTLQEDFFPEEFAGGTFYINERIPDDRRPGDNVVDYECEIRKDGAVTESCSVRIEQIHDPGQEPGKGTIWVPFAVTVDGVDYQTSMWVEVD